MTSEIENILNGQVVRKVNADKAIGVSTANLMPDEKGEIPLSKQSAFEIPTAAETQSAAPVATQEVTEEVDLTQSTPAVPVEETAPIIPTPAVTPTESVVSDTISEAPVSVTEPTELGGIDFKSAIPDIPFAEEPQVQEPVETEVEPVELPEMPEAILAEEPTSVDEGLFVDSPVAPQTAPAVSSEENQESNLPNIIEDNLDSQPSVIENNLESQPNIQEENQPNIQEESKSIFSPEGLVAEDILEDNKIAESGLDTAKPEESKQLLNQEFLDAIREIESDENKKLDSINATLSEVVESLREIKSLFDEKKEVIAETTTLEQPAVSSPIPALPQETPTDVPVVPTPVESAPAPVAAPEPTPMVPTMDIPMFEGPSLELSTGMVQAPNIDKENDMVSALDQMDASGLPPVDETPIKGGMFI